MALPLLIAAAIFAWVGGALHATGHWSVFGTVGGRYVVSGFTLGVAAALCSFPLVIPGVGVYLLLRASVRARWRNDYRHREVSGRWSDREEWLASTSRRFG